MYVNILFHHFRIFKVAREGKSQASFKPSFLSLSHIVSLHPAVTSAQLPELVVGSEPHL